MSSSFYTCLWRQSQMSLLSPSPSTPVVLWINLHLKVAGSLGNDYVTLLSVFIGLDPNKRQFFVNIHSPLLNQIREPPDFSWAHDFLKWWQCSVFLWANRYGCVFKFCQWFVSRNASPGFLPVFPSSWLEWRCKGRIWIRERTCLPEALTTLVCQL